MFVDLISSLQRQFQEQAHQENAHAMMQYMKTTMPFYGVRAPVRKELIKEVLRAYPVARENRQALVAALWQLPHREEKYAAIDIARLLKLYDDPASLSLFKEMIQEGAWWDFVDEIAVRLVGPLLLKNRDLFFVIDQWHQDSNMWLRRTAIICQNKFKEKTDTDRLFAVCLSRAHEKDFFIRKAIGWALREYAKTDEQAVKKFVLAHKDKLSPLSFSQATKHIAL